MKLEDINNSKLIIDEFDIPVAVQINGVEAFRLYDEVFVTADINGYICPGILHSGYGQIIKICRDDTDCYYGVLMKNGAFGYMKCSRMQKVK